MSCRIVSMNSLQIFGLIEAIAAEPKKTKKLELLGSHSSDAELRKVLELALNPAKRFGVKALPSRAGAGAKPFDESHFLLLDRLLTRDLSGTAAREAIQAAFDELDAESAQLLGRILRKDLRAGFSDTTVNKVFPKLLPEFPYMRCSLPKDVKFAEWPWAEGVFSQVKADGMFANVNVEADGFVEVTSRQGSDLPLARLGSIGEYMGAYLAAGYQYHGELMVQRADGAGWATLPREESNGLLNSIIKGGDLPAEHRVIYLAWDMIPLSVVEPKGRYLVPYKERFARLSDLIKASLVPGFSQVDVIPTKIVHSIAEAYAHYREQLALGLEGTVDKRPDAIWRDGDSTEQVKLKLEVPVELEVIGFNEGTGKNAGSLGSFRCASACRRLIVDVSGRGDKMRDEVWADQEDWLGAIITVKANDLLAPKKAGDLFSLFLPIFVERRLDKSVADTLERIEAQFEAAVHG